MCVCVNNKTLKGFFFLRGNPRRFLGDMTIRRLEVQGCIYRLREN